MNARRRVCTALAIPAFATPALAAADKAPERTGFCFLSNNDTQFTERSAQGDGTSRAM
jgi:hypothetical protein